MGKRDLDVIVFGATGYTGRLVTKHLAEIANLEGVRWGIAGRNQDKLEALLSSVKAPAETVCLVADSAKTDELDVVCQKATVVIACAGPFLKVGMPIVDACVRAGTHYVDITGENIYVRQILEKHHDEALKKGIKLVPQSGFDSVPGDLGNFLVNDFARQNGHEVSDVVSFYKMGKGGTSRGTLDSALGAIEHLTKADRSPVSLNPSDKKKNIKVNKPWIWPSFVPGGIGWATVFFMALANNKVVRRTNALMGYDSSYDEAMRVKSLFQGALLSFTLIVFGIVSAIRPLRNFIKKNMGPGAGEGPADFEVPFTVTTRGTTNSGKVIQAKLLSPINAYPATAVFVVQTALAIAHDIERDGKTGPAGAPVAGVLTPMTAVGPLLLPRLARNKLSFEPATVVPK